METRVVRTALFRALLLGTLLALLLWLGMRLHEQTRYGSLGTIDFIQYWSAGSLLLSGENPYDPARLQAVQESLGRSDFQALRMWNPPWLLVLLLPILVLDFSSSAFVWLVLNLVVVLLCSSFIWKLFGGPPGKYMLLAWTFSVFFFPFLMCWGVGQASCLILLGVTLVLWGESRASPWMAGFGLFLVSCKPHPVYLFCLAVVVWIVLKGEWRWVVCAAGLLLVAAVVLTILRPSWASDYLTALANPPHNWATPTLGAVIREYAGLSWSGIQYLPPLVAAIGSAPLLWRAGLGEWHQTISPIILISALTFPFGWSYDQVILLFPALECLVRALRATPSFTFPKALVFFALVGYSVALLAFNMLAIAEIHRYWLTFLPFIAFLGSKRLPRVDFPEAE